MRVYKVTSYRSRFKSIRAIARYPFFYKIQGNGRRNRYNPAEVSGLIIEHVKKVSKVGLMGKRRGGLHPVTQLPYLSRIRADVALIDAFEAPPVSARRSLKPSISIYRFLGARQKRSTSAEIRCRNRRRLSRARLPSHLHHRCDKPPSLRIRIDKGSGDALRRVGYVP